MIISLKDGVKLFGVTVVCFCAAFVCTFFLNFYLDVLPLRGGVSPELLPLYEAQIATAQFCCAITGGVLALIAAVMLLFYVKLYVDEHCKTLGTLKALGHSERRLAVGFTVFGLSTLFGCALGFGLGFAAMPFIYSQLTLEGLTVEISFHPWLLFALVFAPPSAFSVMAYAVASAALRRPALEIMRGRQKTSAKRKWDRTPKERPFLIQAALKTISANKLLTFFIAFSCFCFSAMIQMGLSMERLVSGTMGWMILIIGLVLALTSAFMAMTSLVRNNKKTLALMKTAGYTLKESAAAVFAGFLPFAALGFAVGTGYQFGLLEFMINVIFKNVGEVPEYGFDGMALLITFALFLACYAAIAAYYVAKINKISVKEIMAET